MKKIDKNSKVFELSEFVKDQYKFNIIFKNLDSPTLELYSDEENYLIPLVREDKIDSNKLSIYIRPTKI